jgi:putative polymerase
MNSYAIARSAHSGMAASAKRTVTPAMWLVIIAVNFNLLLCFINSRHWVSVGSGDIIGVELLLLAAGFWLLRARFTRQTIELSLFIIAYLAALRFINAGLDLKILHDLAIMVIFYKLGTLTSVETGSQLLWIVMLIVLAVGLFELVLPVLFGNIFDVWSYYVNKGVIDQDAVKLSQSNLFISGNRGSDTVRNFFPGIFGSHRVSSVFLEPDSLGNFAVVAFAWCLSTAVGSLRSRALLLFFACCCFVLPDSRFASICCVAMLFFKFVLPIRSNLLAFFLPVLVLLGLVVAASLHPMPGGITPRIINDDFAGRLLFSGRLLNFWHLSQWLGLAPSQVYTADTGYAYVINNLGLPLALFLLAVFAAGGGTQAEAKVMKLMVAVYFATSLCVGASVFTIKTAALLWFLYGAANAMPHLNTARRTLR